MNYPGAPWQLPTRKLCTVIIFDLWQTLIYLPHPPISAIWNILVPDIGLDQFLSTMFRSTVFIGAEDTLDSLRRFLMPYTTDPEMLSRCIAIWEHAPTEAVLDQSVESILCVLKARGVKLCLLTNIDRFGYEHFKFPNLLTYFDDQFLSFREGLAKPDVACWEEIRSRMRTRYAEMLMVGDSTEHDLIPAGRLGMPLLSAKRPLRLEAFEPYL